MGAGLAGIALLAFLALRAWGLGAGSPPTYAHPDEHHYAGVAQQLEPGAWNTHYFLNPPLLTFVLAAVRRTAALLVDGDPFARGGELYLVARALSALAGAATALVTAAAARQLLGGRGAGWAAALVVGFSFLHGRDSHYGVNDVPMVLLVSLSLLGAARYLAGGPARALVWSAVWAGLAAGTKYNGAVAVLLAPAALLLRAPGPAPVAAPDAAPSDGSAATDAGAGVVRARAAWLAGLPLLSVLVFVATNPFLLLETREVLDGIRAQYTEWGDRRIWGQATDPPALLYARATLSMLGWAHAAAAVLGAVVLARTRPRAALLLAAFPALYLAGMLSKTLFFWRFALPLLPFLAVSAAAGWQALARRLRPARADAQAGALPRAPAAAAGALLLLPLLGSVEPAARLVRHDRLVTREDTWMQARAWLLAHARWNERVFLEGYPPFFPIGAFRQYRVRGALDHLHEITEPGPGGALVHPVDEGGLLVTDGLHEACARVEGSDRHAAFYARVREHLTLLAEFSPAEDGEGAAFVLDAMYGPLVDLWSIDRPGHTVRIYRLEPRVWRRVMAP